MILERIPDFNRSRLQLHGRPALPQPIHYLSTHFNTRNCKLPHCSEFLDEDNLLRWKQCSWEATANGSMSASNMSGPTDDSSKDSCQFAEHQDRKPVALMSLPGSGNTWVRGLLETATGICTGAVYCDVSLRGTFIGEHVTSGRALVVKTHIDAPPRKSKRNGMFGSAIVLVRNPFKALVAEWNRKVSNGFRERTTVLDSHVSAAGPEWFGRNERWGEYVESQMERWARVIRQWVLSDLIPVLVVQYETLQEDTTHQVRRMLNFLHVEHSQRELEERLGKKFEQYHRNHHPHQFQHFTDEQRVWINSMIKDVSSLLSFSDKSHLLDVDRYILE